MKQYCLALVDEVKDNIMAMATSDAPLDPTIQHVSVDLLDNQSINVGDWKNHEFTIDTGESGLVRSSMLLKAMKLDSRKDIVFDTEKNLIDSPIVSTRMPKKIVMPVNSIQVAKP